MVFEARLFEARFISEEGVYRKYMTDEEINLDQKEKVSRLTQKHLQTYIEEIKKSLLVSLTLCTLRLKNTQVVTRKYKKNEYDCF